MRWTQAQAATALYYHLEAYKRLELGTRIIVPRITRLAVLTEREHVRALSSISGMPGARQVFASSHRVLGRLEALAVDDKLTGKGGKQRLRCVSLCSGMEGATAAFERLGSDAMAVAYSEVNPAANAILRHRWPDVPRVGDLTEFDWAALRGHVDIVLAGPPCQAFSIAGRRLGLQDPRGNLLLHCMRVVRDLQPKWFVVENVPGLLTASRGDDFETFLAAVADSGYACAWRVLDAQHFGLPQRRRRLWIVGERSGDASGPEAILALQESEGRNSAPRRAAWNTPARHSTDCAPDMNAEEDVDWSLAASWLKGRDREVDVAVNQKVTVVEAYAADMRHCALSSEAMTIQVGPASGWSVNATPCVVQRDGDAWLARRFTPLECLRLQGYDDDWFDGVQLGGRSLTDSDRYRLIGNAWSVPVAAWVIERLLNYQAAQQGLDPAHAPAAQEVRIKPTAPV